jgi:hypothetical protein
MTVDNEMESPQHLTEEPAGEVAPVETRGRGRWAREDFGAPRPDDRIIAMMTDLELVSHVQKATAEIRRRAKRNPALYELAGLLLNLPKQEPAKGFFAEIGEKLQNGS